MDKIILPPTGKKVHLGFFELRPLQFWEMALVFCYHQEKFGLNIFPDLKSKQIKKKKTIYAEFVYTSSNINFLKTILLIRLKQIESSWWDTFSLINLFSQICLLG